MASHAVGWQSVPSLEFEEGQLNDIADEIGGLIRLQWDGDHIELNRDWPEIDEEEQLEKQIQAYVDRGLDRERAERIATRRRAPGFARDHPLDSQFQALAANIGASVSGGGGNGHRDYRFSNRRVSGNYQRRNEAYELGFRDLTDTDQKIVFRDRDGKSLSLVYLSEGMTIDFRQTDTGQIRLGIIEEEPHLFVADDYRSLVNEQPEVVQKLIQPLFSHIGIVAPYTEHSPEILKALMTRLVARADSDARKVAALVEILESTKEDNVRNEAARKLAEGFDHWRTSIEGFSTEETLSTQTQKRLKQILAGASLDGARKFIKEQGLMTKPAIFVGMLTGRSEEEKKLILEHLTSLTQQDFGDDVSAWTDWLRKQ